MNTQQAHARAARLRARIDRIHDVKIPRYAEENNAEQRADLEAELERRIAELRYLELNFPSDAA